MPSESVICVTAQCGTKAGRRPTLVLSPAAYNRKVGLAGQVKNLDWRIRQAEFICQIPENIVTAVLQKLETLIS